MERNKEVLVSYLMSVYNDESRVGDAIASVLNQTWHHLELIVVNDGSEDGTRRVLDSVTDPRVRIIHFEKNKGRSAALNEGLKHCRGNVVFINDSDDLALSTRTETIMKLVDQVSSRNWGLVASSSYTVKDGQKRLYRLRKNLFSHVKQGEISRWMVYLLNPFVHSTVAYHRKALLHIGGFADEVTGMIDYLTYLKLSKEHRFYGVGEALEERHVHQNNYFEHRSSQEKQRNRETIYEWIRTNVVMGSLFVLMNQFVNQKLSRLIAKMKK